MTESVRLGRIAGIEVGANWSILVIFMLIALGLAGGRFPALYPDHEPVTYVVAGFTAGLVFLLSLLAHEVSHAVVARQNGVEVEGITLWLFGGVARLSGEADNPSAEMRIAGVGPLVSLLLGGLFGVLGLVLDLADLPEIVVGMLGWLAVINAVLAVFNLVPAAPLDGGRLLRALIWKRRGDRTSASITAARAGRGFGWLLVVVGLTQFVGGAGLGGLWLVLIGWFLTSAAGAEEQHARLRRALGNVHVADVMTPDPATAPGHISVAEFVEDYVFPNRFSTFPIVGDDGGLAGLVTLNRVKQVAQEDRPRTTLETVACPAAEVLTAEPGETLVDLLARLQAGEDGRAVVLDGGRIVGIVSPSDVARQLELVELRGGRELEHL